MEQEAQNNLWICEKSDDMNNFTMKWRGKYGKSLERDLNKYATVLSKFHENRHTLYLERSNTEHDNFIWNAYQTARTVYHMFLERKRLLPRFAPHPSDSAEMRESKLRSSTFAVATDINIPFEPFKWPKFEFDAEAEAVPPSMEQIV